MDGWMDGGRLKESPEASPEYFVAITDWNLNESEYKNQIFNYNNQNCN